MGLLAPLKDPDLTHKAMTLNLIGSRFAASEKLPVNDLFSLMNPLDLNKFWTDTYHFSTEARKQQAHQVSESVRKLLGARTVSAGQAAAAIGPAASPSGPSGAINTGTKK